MHSTISIVTASTMIGAFNKYFNYLKTETCAEGWKKKRKEQSIIGEALDKFPESIRTLNARRSIDSNSQQILILW